MSGWKPTELDDSELDPCLKRLQRRLDPSSSSSTSKPDMILPKRTSFLARNEKAEFLWIWLFGEKLPSVSIGGEPLIPLSLITDIISRSTNFDLNDFQRFLRNRSVFISLASRNHVNMLYEKSEACKGINSINLELIRRSDIERVIGELRIESDKMADETDFWQHFERFAVTHYNFVDYKDDLFENGDLEEDVWRAGICGHFYKSRHGMRCIICMECHHKFTPNDFSIHHHRSTKYDGLFHIGLNSGRWAQTICPFNGPETTAENALEWKKFIETVPGSNKRRQDLQLDDPVVRRAFERVNNMLPKKKLEKDEEHIKIIDRETAPAFDFNKAAIQAQKKTEELNKIHPGHFDPTKISIPMKPFSVNNGLLNMLQQPLNTLLLTQLSDNAIFKKPALPISLPLPVPSKQPVLTAATFDWKQGEFRNICYQNCSEKTKYEINLLKMGLRQIEKDSRKVQNENLQKRRSSVVNGVSKVGHSNEPGWQAVLKEQSLLKNLSDEAIRVLDGKPIIQQPQQPLKPPKVVDIPSPIVPFPLLDFKQPLQPPLLPPYDLLLKSQQIQNLLQLLPQIPQLPASVTTTAK